MMSNLLNPKNGNSPDSQPKDGYLPRSTKAVGMESVAHETKIKKVPSKNTYVKKLAADFAVRSKMAAQAGTKKSDAESTAPRTGQPTTNDASIGSRAKLAN